MSSTVSAIDKGRPTRSPTLGLVGRRRHPLHDRARIFPVEGNGQALRDQKRDRSTRQIGLRSLCDRNPAEDLSSDRAPSPAVGLLQS